MSPDPTIKISIITVCRNSEVYLEATIQSVISQAYPGIEYIIIDGQSTDGTLQIIEKYKSKLAATISEPDNGMYDAINKGLQLATGDYIAILNSDDALANENTITEIVNEISKERLPYYYGNVLRWKQGRLKKIKLFPVTYKQLLLSTHCTFIHHPSFFIAAPLNKELEGYRSDYRYASDYDYILRALQQTGSKGKYVNQYTTKFRVHEGSITASGKLDSERKNILQEHGYYKFGAVTRFVSYYLLWIFYKLVNLPYFYKKETGQ